MYIGVILACMIGGKCIYFVDQSPDEKKFGCIIKVEEMTKIIRGLDMVVIERSCGDDIEMNPKIEILKSNFPASGFFNP